MDFIEPHLFDTDISSDTRFAFRVLEDLTEQDRGGFEELRLSEGLGFPIFRIFRITFDLRARTIAKHTVRFTKIVDLRLKGGGVVKAWYAKTASRP